MAYGVSWGKSTGQYGLLTSELKNNIVSELSAGTAELIKNNLQEIITRITELEERLSSAQESQNSEQITSLLKEAYASVMQIRELFTKDVINYRIFTGNTQSGYISKSLTTEELLSNGVSYRKSEEALYVLGNSLRGIESSLDKSFDSMNYIGIDDEEYNKRISKRISEIEKNYMKKVRYTYTDKDGNERHGSGWQINPDAPIDEQIKKQLMLIDSKTGEIRKDKNGNIMYRTYTEGHLLEGLARYETTESKDSNFNFNTFFASSLRADNISGFQGGDVGSWQIKKGNARLMKASTLTQKLSDIKRTLQALKEGKTEISKTLNDNSTMESIKSHLTNMFTNDQQTDSKLNDLLETAVGSVVDDFIKAIGAHE